MRGSRRKVEELIWLGSGGGKVRIVHCLSVYIVLYSVDAVKGDGCKQMRCLWMSLECRCGAYKALSGKLRVEGRGLGTALVAINLGLGEKGMAVQSLYLPEL